VKARGQKENTGWRKRQKVRVETGDAPTSAACAKQKAAKKLGSSGE
jgi:hypothetical protein